MAEAPNPNLARLKGAAPVELSDGSLPLWGDGVRASVPGTSVGTSVEGRSMGPGLSSGVDSGGSSLGAQAGRNSSGTSSGGSTTSGTSSAASSSGYSGGVTSGGGAGDSVGSLSTPAVARPQNQSEEQSRQPQSPAVNPTPSAAPASLGQTGSFDSTTLPRTSAEQPGQNNNNAQHRIEQALRPDASNAAPVERAAPSREPAPQTSPSPARPEQEVARARESLNQQTIVERPAERSTERSKLEPEKSIYSAPTLAEKEQARLSGREREAVSPSERVSARDGVAERAPVAPDRVPGALSERVIESRPRVDSATQSSDREAIRTPPQVTGPESRVEQRTDTRSAEPTLRDLDIRRPQATESNREPVAARTEPISPRNVERNETPRNITPTQRELPVERSGGKSGEPSVSRAEPQILKPQTRTLENRRPLSRDPQAGERNAASSSIRIRDRAPKTRQQSAAIPGKGSEQAVAKTGVRSIADRIKELAGVKRPGLKERVTKEGKDAAQARAKHQMDKAGRGTAGDRPARASGERSPNSRDRGTDVRGLKGKAQAKDGKIDSGKSYSDRVKSDTATKNETRKAGSGRSLSDRTTSEKSIRDGQTAAERQAAREDRTAGRVINGQRKDEGEISPGVKRLRERAQQSPIKLGKDGLRTEDLGGPRGIDRLRDPASKEQRAGTSLTERVRQGTASPVERVTHEVVEFMKGIFGIQDNEQVEVPNSLQEQSGTDLENQELKIEEEDLREDLEHSTEEQELELALSDGQVARVYSIRGKVVEFASAKPLSGITVELAGYSTCLTDVRGEYVFEDILEGTQYQILVQPCAYDFTPDRVSGVVSGYATHHFFGKQH